VTGRIVVIGVGNGSRRDDGVGWVVASEAARRLGDVVEVRWCDGEPARLLDAWTDAELAVVVDAVRRGAEPGSICVLTADDAAVTTPAAPLGGHALGVGQAVALGRALGLLPRRLVVVGIEGRDYGVGEGLSAPVLTAVAAAADLVAGMVSGALADGVPDRTGAAALRG
jgi:hydrogenase maturation protease